MARGSSAGCAGKMNPGEASFSFFRCLASPSAPHSVSAGNTGVGHAHPNTMVTSGYLTHCWQWYASLRGAAFLLACILVMHFHATRAPLYYSTRELTNYILASVPHQKPPTPHGPHGSFKRVLKLRRTLSAFLTSRTSPSSSQS